MTPNTLKEITEFDQATKTLITNSDTFFVASVVNNGTGEASEGADISHRGGLPGFVRVDNNHSLTRHNYNVTTKPNSAGTFPILLLEKKRIDAVFLTSVVFRNELTQQSYSVDDYVEVVEKSKPFGIYISKAYLIKYPDFMNKLNTAIIKIQDLN
jgi:ABC-type amino acid transport substrate-binding protein